MTGVITTLNLQVGVGVPYSKASIAMSRDQHSLPPQKPQTPKPQSILAGELLNLERGLEFRV